MECTGDCNLLGSTHSLKLDFKCSKHQRLLPPGCVDTFLLLCATATANTDQPVASPASPPARLVIGGQSVALSSGSSRSGWAW